MCVLTIYLQDEFEMNMRLLGARTIDELVPEMVDASALNQHIVGVPTDNLFQQTCKCSFFLRRNLVLTTRPDQPLQITKLKL